MSAVLWALMLCAVLFHSGDAIGSHSGNPLVNTELSRAKVIGGQPVAVAQPWMASLQVRSGSLLLSHFCGASMIAPRWAMTAAHCVLDRLDEDVEVFVGDLKQVGSNSQRYEVSAIFVHPDYQNTNFDNDIALLYLDCFVTDISPQSACQFPQQFVALPSLSDFANLPLGQLLKVFGWGGIDAASTSFPVVLQSAELPLVDCNSNSVTENEFCAGALGKDSCAGDSGGPLIWDNNHVATQVGIVSFGFGLLCGQSLPGVYTKVASYPEWIRRIQTGVAVESQLDRLLSELGPSQRIPVRVYNFTASAVSITAVTIDNSRFTMVETNCVGTLAADAHCLVTLAYLHQTGEGASTVLTVRADGLLFSGRVSVADSAMTVMPISPDPEPDGGGGGSALSLTTLWTLLGLLLLARWRQVR